MRRVTYNEELIGCAGLDWCGLGWVAWSGLVWPGLAWYGRVWSGLAWLCLFWSGLVSSGCLVWSAAAGMLWSVLPCSGLLWSAVICSGLPWSALVSPSHETSTATTIAKYGEDNGWSRTREIRVTGPGPYWSLGLARIPQEGDMRERGGGRKRCQGISRWWRIRDPAIPCHSVLFVPIRCYSLLYPLHHPLLIGAHHYLWNFILRQVGSHRWESKCFVFWLAPRIAPCRLDSMHTLDAFSWAPNSQKRNGVGYYIINSNGFKRTLLMNITMHDSWNRKALVHINGN